MHSASACGSLHSASISILYGVSEVLFDNFVFAFGMLLKVMFASDVPQYVKEFPQTVL